MNAENLTMTAKMILRIQQRKERKPLGSKKYIVNVQDRGYCFVAPVTRGVAEQ